MRGWIFILLFAAQGEASFAKKLQEEENAGTRGLFQTVRVFGTPEPVVKLNPTEGSLLLPASTQVYQNEVNTNPEGQIHKINLISTLSQIGFFLVMPAAVAGLTFWMSDKIETYPHLDPCSLKPSLNHDTPSVKLSETISQYEMVAALWFLIGECFTCINSRAMIGRPERHSQSIDLTALCAQTVLNTAATLFSYLIALQVDDWFDHNSACISAHPRLHHVRTLNTVLFYSVSAGVALFTTGRIFQNLQVHKLRKPAI